MADADWTIPDQVALVDDDGTRAVVTADELLSENPDTRDEVLDALRRVAEGRAATLGGGAAPLVTLEPLWAADGEPGPMDRVRTALALLHPLTERLDVFLLEHLYRLHVHYDSELVSELAALPGRVEHFLDGSSWKVEAPGFQAVVERSPEQLTGHASFLAGAAYSAGALDEEAATVLVTLIGRCKRVVVRQRYRFVFYARDAGVAATLGFEGDALTTASRAVDRLRDAGLIHISGRVVDVDLNALVLAAGAEDLVEPDVWRRMQRPHEPEPVEFEDA